MTPTLRCIYYNRAYKVPYKELTTTEIKTDIDRILRYLEKNTPTRVVSKRPER